MKSLSLAVYESNWLQQSHEFRTIAVIFVVWNKFKKKKKVRDLNSFLFDLGEFEKAATHFRWSCYTMEFGDVYFSDYSIHIFIIIVMKIHFFAWFFRFLNLPTACSMCYKV